MIPCTGHLRDIMKLSQAARINLFRNNRLVAVSQATKDAYISELVDEKSITVIPNGIDLERFSPAPSTGFLHRELGLPTEAREIDRNDRPNLSQKRTGSPFDRRVVARGSGTRRPFLSGRRALLVEGRKRSIRRANRPRIRATRDWRSPASAGISGGHPIVTAREFDVLFHPARQEPLGRVLLEAAASGCPVVATDVGGTAEIFTPGESALLFPVDDCQSASQSLADVLNERPPTLRSDTHDSTHSGGN